MSVKSKKMKPLEKIIILVAIICNLAPVIFLLVYFGVYTSASKKEVSRLCALYNDENNYSTRTGIIDVFYYSFFKEDSYYHGFTFFENDTDSSNDSIFMVYAQSSVILKEKNFYKDVTIGNSEITITFANDNYLGNLPVVAIYMDGKCYLDFETGKTNLLKYMKYSYLN